MHRLSALFAVSCLVLVSVPATAAPAPLFSSATLEVAPIDRSEEMAVHRQRLVDLNVEALGGLAADPSVAATSLYLNLFEDVTLVAQRTDLERNRSGSLTWIGTVADDPFSSLTLVTKDGITVGSIRAHGSLYLLFYAGGPHVIYDVDEASPVYQEEEPTPVNLDPVKAAAADAQARGAAVQDDGSIQDLMVVYTAQAVSAVGNVTAVENLIDLGVSETNQGYANSGILHRINLVHTAQVDYTEAGSVSTDRNRLRNPSDGFLDDVHALRDQYSADIVKMIVSGGGCGIAYIMNPVSVDFEDFAFCVTQYSCVSPNYTFAHELGHIQSARHDYFVDPTVNAPFSYNHGYRDPQNRWRTVMAYSNGCGGCQRQLFWSNPDVDHPSTGNPMGIAEGEPQAADNRKTLNTTAWTVANFRVGESVFVDGFEAGNFSSWSQSVID
ncbi:MAG: M12 family metallo-peptidase [Acidobacteriota bacterium]